MGQRVKGIFNVYNYLYAVDVVMLKVLSCVAATPPPPPPQQKPRDEEFDDQKYKKKLHTF